MATLGELAAALGIIGTVTATAIPHMLAGLDDAREAGAARYLSSRLAESRMGAIQKSREVAVRFEQTAGGYRFAVYLDGNGNGVLTRDIERGIDTLLQGPEKLSDSFRNVDFGLQAALPAIDGGAAPVGDPIKLGVGKSASFSAMGTATSGTI